MIFKKILLTTTLLLSSSYLYAGAELSIKDIQKGDSITFSATQAQQAWIGIYEANQTTEWKNVRSWNWLKDGVTTLNTKALLAGEYEAKLFFNNSFDEEQKVSFTIKPDGNNTKPQVQRGERWGTFFATQKEQAWLGVYEADKTTDWENVKTWCWLESGSCNISLPILQAGDYEVRLFFNNSFKEEANFPFEIGRFPGNSAPIFDDNQTVSNSQPITVKHIHRSTKGNWIGIFKEGSAYTRENLEGWNYVNGTVTTLKPINGVIETGVYDLVLFINDTYEQEGRTAKLTVTP